VTAREDMQREMDALAEREAQLDALLRELWDERDERAIGYTHVGWSLILTDEQAQRIMALLGIKEE
jgi:hypothetical protein